MTITLTSHISLTDNGRQRHRSYTLTALDLHREPLAGVEVDIVLVDEFGAFDPRDPTQRRHQVVTGDDGEGVVDWFEFPPHGETLPASAELRLTCTDERVIDVTLEAHIAMPWI